METSREDFKKLVVDSGLIKESDFNVVAKEAERAGQKIETYLVKRGLVSDEKLGELVAKQHGYHFIDLRKITIDPSVLNIISEVIARSRKIIAFEWTREVIKVATPNPDDHEIISLLEKKTGYKFDVYYTTPLSFEEALRFYRSNLETDVKNLIAELKKNPEKEENIVRLVNYFIEYAFDNRASDIHIEPQKSYVLVRFRIDGILHEVVSYDKMLHDKIVSRVKIMSRLRTDEHGAAQDGRFAFEVSGIAFDVRVSVVPVTDGENVVMRLLAERAENLSIDDLGFLEADLKKVKHAATKSYGMILAVGPTGSGKTTTLYAILRTLNKPEVNIMTIEDPVEYDIEHVQQIQANPRKGLTFADGLRSIVRQDPNVIMVGEIRDNETAGIAINAAMTGHLLLSTLHANDAATTFPRLIELDVEPFLVASSVNVIMARRLVRRVCKRCKISYNLSAEELNLIKDEKELIKYIKEAAKEDDLAKIKFYKGQGCAICSSTGYVGRIGISEVLEVTDELRPLIVQKASADVISKKAIELGMAPMLYDGAVKIIEGTTTLEEVIRTTRT